MKAEQLDTEGKIKEAARIVFTQKGYAAARTRDIAEEAGINLSLLNYYFRSKEKLFNIIMTEKIQQFFGVMFPIISDDQLTLEVKMEQFVSRYIDMLQSNPDLPIFVLSEIRNNPKHFVETIKADQILINSSLMKQLQERNKDINPVHFILNLLGMSVFPFLAKPILMSAGVLKENSFGMLMDERKKWIPIWMKALLDS